MASATAGAMHGGHYRQPLPNSQHEPKETMNTKQYLVTIEDAGNITDKAENVRTILTSTDRILPRERVAVEPATATRDLLATVDRPGTDRSIHSTIDLLCRTAQNLAPRVAQSALDSGCTDTRPLDRSRSRDAWDLVDLAFRLNSIADRP
jgi:hypothetical protein